jgi:hypothetical protein
MYRDFLAKHLYLRFDVDRGKDLEMRIRRTYLTVMLRRRPPLWRPLCCRTTGCGRLCFIPRAQPGHPAMLGG